MAEREGRIEGGVEPKDTREIPGGKVREVLCKFSSSRGSDRGAMYSCIVMKYK